MIVMGLLLSGLTGSLLFGAIGMGVGAGLFLLIHLLGFFLLKEEAMGMGDVKLAAGIGAFLGWRIGLICFFISFILGAVVATILLLAHLKKRKDRIPFAPFLVAAALVSLFLGEKLLYFYLSLVYY